MGIKLDSIDRVRKKKKIAKEIIRCFENDKMAAPAMASNNKKLVMV
jgi:hypothetical protein